MVHFPVVGLVRPDVKDDVLHGGGTLEVMAFLLYYKLSISYFCLQLRCTLLTKTIFTIQWVLLGVVTIVRCIPQ